ncbi:hypothetical protein GGI1_00080, partial [Acidithiobacillus sp. GGI-221]
GLGKLTHAHPTYGHHWCTRTNILLVFIDRRGLFQKAVYAFRRTGMFDLVGTNDGHGGGDIALTDQYLLVFLFISRSLTTFSVGVLLDTSELFAVDA